VVISWFATDKPKGSAIGEAERTAWDQFTGILSWYRREGEKDGPNFVPARSISSRTNSRSGALGLNLIVRAVSQSIPRSKRLIRRTAGYGTRMPAFPPLGEHMRAVTTPQGRNFHHCQLVLCRSKGMRDLLKSFFG
jgi:hypothetical protein